MSLWSELAFCRTGPVFIIIFVIIFNLRGPTWYEDRGWHTPSEVCFELCGKYSKCKTQLLKIPTAFNHMKWPSSVNGTCSGVIIWSTVYDLDFVVAAAVFFIAVMKSIDVHFHTIWRWVMCKQFDFDCTLFSCIFLSPPVSLFFSDVLSLPAADCPPCSGVCFQFSQYCIFHQYVFGWWLLFNCYWR